MKKNQIKLAVAGAVLGMASVANAGIIIPAGEWTVDVGGNVNAYSIWAKTKGTQTIVGGLNSGAGTAGSWGGAAPSQTRVQNFNNGLLPNFLSVSGSTRQNDLDVSFTISLQPGTAATTALTDVNSSSGNGGLNNRQAFLTFGDKSWGSVKMGKDLGIFASDAILSDITLLGVGGTAGGAGNTTLGRIGSGYIYADWKPQFSYTTPNFSGFQATVGITSAFTANTAVNASGADSATVTNAGLVASGTYLSSSRSTNMAYEGKASYSFAANGVDGKVWVSGIAQHVGAVGTLTANQDPTAYAGDVGIKLSAAGFDAVGYYYAGQGIGTTGQMLNGYGQAAAATAAARDSDGGYVQLAYTLPTKTKVAASWGISNLDLASGELVSVALTGSDAINSGNLVKSNEQWNAMLIHPLTKHLNVVAEYSHLKAENQNGLTNTTDAGSLGAILFF